jgi:hypothetical protein
MTEAFTYRRRFLVALIGVHALGQLVSLGAIIYLIMPRINGQQIGPLAPVIEWLEWAFAPSTASLLYLLAMWAALSGGQVLIRFTAALLALVSIHMIPNLVSVWIGHLPSEAWWGSVRFDIPVFAGSFLGFSIAGRRAGWRVAPAASVVEESAAPTQPIFQLRDLFWLTTITAVVFAAIRAIPASDASIAAFALGSEFVRALFLLPSAHLALRPTGQRKLALVSLVSFVGMVAWELMIVFALVSHITAEAIWRTTLRDAWIFSGVGGSLWLVRMAGYRLVRANELNHALTRPDRGAGM